MSTNSKKPPVDPRVAKANQQPANQENPEDEDEEGGISQRFILFQVMPSWLTSFIFHIILIIVLALIWFTKNPKKVVDLFSGEASQQTNSTVDVDFDSIEVDTESLETEVDETVTQTDFESEIEETPMAETLEVENLDPAVSQLEPTDFGAEMNSLSAMKTDVASRSKAMRKRMLEANGGNSASERAVELGLKWIAAHQLKDGSWNFDHRKAGPNKTSPDPGRMSGATRAATGMALMCFLGAGQTHMEGDYKETVRKGLAYLIRVQKAESNGGSFWEPEGNMYSHGIASIAMAEAWSMTRDEKLKVPAQAAINYIIQSQHAGGGWRYRPNQAGDTSVVGWQVMALKSANMSNLKVPARTIKGAEKFLDSVSENSGSEYGYLSPDSGRKTLTAVGLLCRMYMGWQHEHPALERGVKILSNYGPAIDKGARLNWNMYYNYYATQVLKQYGGDEWKKWNKVMRDELIKTQSQKGQATGSWYFEDDWHANSGGRLYCTTLAVMTLEVYYRYMPLYGDKVQKDEFEF